MLNDSVELSQPNVAADEMRLSVRDLVTEFHLPGRVVRAVDGVSFDVAPAEIFGIVGETGCGKSATMRSILGLIRPPGKVTAGEARFAGNDLIAMAPKQRRLLLGAQIGFVAQNPWGSLNPVMRVRRQFDDRFRTHTKLSRSERQARAEELLRAVEIRDVERVLNGYAHELSGGMAQRVVIALALACEPSLVIADEPTTALDLTVQAEMLDLLAHLATERGFSTIIVTHDLGVVAQYCNSMAVMYAGRVVETGKAADVLESPSHPYTAGLLAAIPQPGRELSFLGGRVPDLSRERQGCAFADRCSFVTDTPCRTDTPELLEVSPGRRSACHHYEQLVREGER